MESRRLAEFEQAIIVVFWVRLRVAVVLSFVVLAAPRSSVAQTGDVVPLRERLRRLVDNLLDAGIARVRAEMHEAIDEELPLPFLGVEVDDPMRPGGAVLQAQRSRARRIFAS